MRGPEPSGTPAVILVYGVLGLIPFLAPPPIGHFAPQFAGLAGTLLAAYGALILSFLGGARWGLAASADQPNPLVVSLAMLPTLAGLALLALPPGHLRLQLVGLMIALGLHWLWDVRSSGLPAWYPRLRTLLSLGAILGLAAGLILLPH